MNPIGTFMRNLLIISFLTLSCTTAFAKERAAPDVGNNVNLLNTAERNIASIPELKEIQDNNSPEAQARAKNRRVEFKIVDNDKPKQ